MATIASASPLLIEASEASAAQAINKRAVLFTPTAGDEAGKTFLVVDANGTAGYQANADLVIDVSHMVHASSFGLADFT